MALPQLHVPLQPKRILVVDDEPLVAQTIRRVLVTEGHTVELADSGELALSLFKEGQFDLVITDFILGGMDGLELAQAIKAASPQKPVILITAFAERITSSTGKVSNVDFLMRKPFAVAELQKALRSVFPTN
ncbi:MAG TPA: response regulator [Verrucomicrobiae bacterium]|nr:response regulator [Verrucomicrobiae bacterium]